MAEWDEIVIVMDNASRKKTNTIATNVKSTALINYESKNVEIVIICTQFHQQSYYY